MHDLAFDPVSKDGRPLPWAGRFHPIVVFGIPVSNSNRDVRASAGQSRINTGGHG
jgi:hypothetical protein